VWLDGVSRAMALVTARAINTFYTRSPELIDSHIVRIAPPSFCRMRVLVLHVASPYIKYTNPQQNQ